jgi:hypothetical protein
MDVLIHALSISRRSPGQERICHVENRANEPNPAKMAIGRGARL